MCQSAPQEDNKASAAPVAAKAAAPAKAAGGAAKAAAPAKAASKGHKEAAPVVIVSTRIPKDGAEDDIEQFFQACVKHMKNKLGKGLIGMYAYYDQDDNKKVHDVMIFDCADTIHKWSDDMVKWPATRAGRPIQEWVINYDSSAENWWTGVVFGGWNEGCKDRLAEMGAKLQWLKAGSNGTGYLKQKVKKTKDMPVCMYSKRQLKVRPHP